jgi:hypothetical protein
MLPTALYALTHQNQTLCLLSGVCHAIFDACEVKRSCDAQHHVDSATIFHSIAVHIDSCVRMTGNAGLTCTALHGLASILTWSAVTKPVGAQENSPEYDDERGP